MSQERILLLLGQYKGRWFTANEMSKLLGLHKNTVNNNLRKIREHEPQITYERIGKGLHVTYAYRWKQ